MSQCPSVQLVWSIGLLHRQHRTSAPASSLRCQRARSCWCFDPYPRSLLVPRALSLSRSCLVQRVVPGSTRVGHPTSRHGCLATYSLPMPSRCMALSLSSSASAAGHPHDPNGTQHSRHHGLGVGCQSGCASRSFSNRSCGSVIPTPRLAWVRVARSRDPCRHSQRSQCGRSALHCRAHLHLATRVR